MNPMKDQISADFEKAKSAGGARVGRIRQIFQDALTQTVSELKQGAGEIGSIAKESTSTLTENLKNAQKTASENEVVPVQVEIHDEVEAANLVVVSVEPTATEPSLADVQPSEQSVQPSVV